ncbi:MAG: AraC family transcriptional regulator [Opitutaceae bacterium]|nr:AraC family transcriptional regulator [Opitutaceae bacterium]
MLQPQESLRETHLIGPKCREWIVSHERFPQVRAARLLYIGHSVLYPPYRMVRMPVRDSHVLASISGKGRTLLAGKEQVWQPGQVLLCPRGKFHAFEIDGRGPWKIAWVFFGDRVGRPVIDGDTRLVDADGRPFVQVVQALTQEASGPADPAALQALATLVDLHARRLANTRAGDDRLWRLWEAVESDLGNDWTVRLMAARVAMSEEHLRRLCQAEHGKAPMEHVFHLRMHRAAALLRTSALKLDDIAQRVGFASVYSFSAAFKRWSGLPPSNFREAGQQKTPAL